MKDSDFIFEDEEQTEEKLEGKFKPGDSVFVNSVEFTIEELVNIKKVGDSLGFPALYSWYKATDPEGKKTNLFFYDDDIDCKEDNDLVATDWYKTYLED